MQRGETTAKDLSNEPKTKVLGKNLTSVELVESLVTKQSFLKVVLTCSSPKVPWSDYGWNIPRAWTQGHSPASCKSIIYHRGLLLRSRGAKDGHRLFCSKALRKPFQHLTNKYTCKEREGGCRVGKESNVFQKQTTMNKKGIK